jgi:amino acid adenylation domain-containing protein
MDSNYLANTGTLPKSGITIDLLNSNPRQQQETALSFAQRRFWQIDSAETLIHRPITLCLRLCGRWDPGAIRAALDQIVARHDVLRTTYFNVEGEVLQRVGPRDIGFTWAHREGPDTAASSWEWVADLRDPSSGPLIRGHLSQVSGDEYVLVIAAHPIVFDHGSIEVLIHELASFYSVFALGQSNPLLPLKIQYSDYATRQRRDVNDDALKTQLKFWAQTLSDAPELLDLPTDRPRRAVASYSCNRVPLMLPGNLTKRLERLSQMLGVSLFVTLLSGWVLVLARWSRQKDLVVGARLMNRQSPESEPLIGAFESIVALRVRLEEVPTVEQLIRQVKITTADAYAHQDLPFGDIVDDLVPVRSLGHSPIFQVLISLNESPRAAAVTGELRSRGLALSEEPTPNGRTELDLSLALNKTSEGIAGTVEYASDLFDDETIRRLVSSWKVALDAMTLDVERPINELPLITAAERDQLIVAFNNTAVPESHCGLVHQIFENQADSTPTALSVVCGDRHLTYASLNSRANQIAHELLTRGVQPDDRVGLCIERGIDFAVGLLGILKAGGAYVPLDPNYPTERLAFMLEDSSPVAVLTQSSVANKIASFATTVVMLDADSPRSVENPEVPGLTSRNTAYVIYTSGTSGKPKGVMIEHRSACNLVVALIEEFDVQTESRVLQFASPSFDASIWEVLMSLCRGASLHIPDRGTVLVGGDLSAMLIDRKITHATLPPTVLQSIEQNSAPECLKTIIVAGEPCPATLVAEWAHRRRFVNAYGPTEATVCATMFTCTPDAGRSPGIGRPIANCHISILDDSGKMVPIGVVGEIHIGGAGIARGYLNQPRLTALCFVPDLFRDEPAARLYKTGDLGRWHSDGTIEYLGRNDFQVKIRGFRVEPGEVELALLGHPDVKHATVITREDVAGEKRLVGYVVPNALRDKAQKRNGGEVDSEYPTSEPESKEPTAVSETQKLLSVLREYLKERLPPYMTPAAIVIMNQLPLTVSGKIDRGRLPLPEWVACERPPYESPLGNVEEALAQIWGELLRIERIGRGDNFFELGGHSLLIVRMMEELRRVNLSAELRDVYERPTLATLASKLAIGPVERVEISPNLIPADCEEITPQMLPLVELTPNQIERIVRAVPGGASNIQDIYPLAPLQEGILFHHLFTERNGDTYILSTLLSFSSRVKLDAWVSALQQVIERHDILRTAILWEQLERPVQVVQRQAVLSVEELKGSPNHTAIEQLTEQMMPDQQRLDLRRAPLLRLQVVADAESEQWYALLQLHHLVGDHESLWIIVSEVMAHLEGQAHELPEPIPYRIHVAQVQSQARPEATEAFFREKLGTIREPTAPFGLFDVYVGGGRTDENRQPLELPLTQRLRAQARRSGVSPATLFHSAWGLVLARTTGRDDVVFGSVLLGRLRGSAGARRILGMFINTLPLRLRLKNLMAGELVAQTQRELVDLLNYEQASLSVAQRCSGVVGMNPLFTTLLNYVHSAPNPGADWACVAGISVIDFKEWTNYPISLTVDDTGDAFVLTAHTDRRIEACRITGYMQAALESLVIALEGGSPSLALVLPILPRIERHLVIDAFNAPNADYNQDALIHELFENQVERTPKEIAVVYEGQALTFAALNDRANRVAGFLRGLGIGPDRLVGICIDRSIEMLVALLGILKAGGAYVPLDPAYPPARLAHIVEDAEPGVILTQKDLVSRFSHASGRVVTLNEIEAAIVHQNASNLNARAYGLRPENLAYVIYTSGSTGRPKGVMVEHRNVVSLWQGLEHLYRQSILCRRIGLNASISFDASVKQIIQLLSGRSIVLIPDESRLDSVRMLRYADVHQIDGFDCTPSQLRGLVSAGLLTQATRYPRVVLIGGEPIDAQLWDCLGECSGKEFYNVYGPTECTVDAAFTQVTSAVGAPHIGRPMENRRIYILDEYRGPMPVGVAGEIYIGGPGVARGYLGAPLLTSERFLADPFDSGQRSRMYRTGDIARWRPNGMIEYVGRNDHQVKVRGFRIELGEIEARLLLCPQVREAIVLARQDEPGDRRLVAYVIPSNPTDPGHALTANGLREHLKITLPDYMLPSAFVVLDRFPLGANGKVDRDALPKSEACLSTTFEPPDGEIEEMLAATWRKLLHVERVGRQDNFFDLGGHSLLVTRVISRIREVLGIEVAVREFFDQPNLVQLAASVEQQMREANASQTLARDGLARNLSQRIDAMDEDAMLARIAELEKDSRRRSLSVDPAER